MPNQVFPPEAWTAINTIGLAVIAILAFINNRTATKKRDEQVKEIREVKEIVNGPLSVALQSNADLSAHVATLTGSHTDAQFAVKAATLNQNRKEGRMTEGNAIDKSQTKVDDQAQSAFAKSDAAARDAAAVAAAAVAAKKFENPKLGD